jgi:hypothetical protein
MIELLTEIAKLITPLLLITLAVQQYWAKVAADRRGVKVEAAANKAQLAATHAAEEATEVAVKTEGVRKALIDSNSATSSKLDNLTTQTDKVHTLVNSNMGLQLKIAATLARRLADLTGLESDKKIADGHEQLSRDHELKQAAVDHKEANGAGEAP